MDKRSIVLVVSLFLLIIGGMFLYASLKRSEQAVMVKPVASSDEVTVPYSDISRITAKHYIIEGLHTFVGVIEMPTPCDLLDTDVAVAESYPEQITLDFKVINNSESCMQVITQSRFLIEAKASSEATVKAVFMGRPVELNLIPAAPGEIPEEFELFIKG